MKFIKNNIIPLLFTISVMTGLFFILSYISYDIHNYKPSPVDVSDISKGRIENIDYIPSVDTESLDKYYTPPEPVYTQPSIPSLKFKIDNDKLYNWLGLENPANIQQKD